MDNHRINSFVGRKEKLHQRDTFGVSNFTRNDKRLTFVLPEVKLIFYRLGHQLWLSKERHE